MTTENRSIQVRTSSVQAMQQKDTMINMIRSIVRRCVSCWNDAFYVKYIVMHVDDCSASARIEMVLSQSFKGQAHTVKRTRLRQTTSERERRRKKASSTAIYKYMYPIKCRCIYQYVCVCVCYRHQGSLGPWTRVKARASSKPSATLSPRACLDQWIQLRPSQCLRMDRFQFCSMKKSLASICQGGSIWTLQDKIPNFPFTTRWNNLFIKYPQADRNA